MESVYFRPAPPCTSSSSRGRCALPFSFSVARHNGRETSQDLAKFTEAVFRTPRVYVSPTRPRQQTTRNKHHHFPLSTPHLTPAKDACLLPACLPQKRWRPGSVRRALDRPCGVHRTFVLSEEESLQTNLVRLFEGSDMDGNVSVPNGVSQARQSDAYLSLFEFHKLRTVEATPLHRMSPLLVKATFLAVCNASGVVTLQQLRSVFDVLGVGVETSPGAAEVINAVRSTASSNCVTYAQYKRLLSAVLCWDPLDTFGHLLAKLRSAQVKSVTVVTTGEMQAFLQCCHEAVESAVRLAASRPAHIARSRTLLARMEAIAASLDYDRVGVAPFASFLDMLKQDKELWSILRPPGDLMSLIDSDVDLDPICKEFLTASIASATGAIRPFHPDLSAPRTLRWPPHWKMNRGGGGGGGGGGVSPREPTEGGSRKRHGKVAHTWLQRALEEKGAEGVKLGPYGDLAAYVLSEPE